MKNKFLMFCALLIFGVCAFSTQAATEEKFFDSKGVKIHYLDEGQGEPVVLVHGQGGSIQSWRDEGVFQNLVRDHRVIALDCRGHGMSGKPHDPNQYGQEMALDIVRLLDHLGIARAHIVGYSMGAQLTGLLLVLHPERFLTAALGGGTGRFLWTDRDNTIAEQEAVEYEKLGISPTLVKELSLPNTPQPSAEELKKLSDAALANPNQDRFAIAALIRSRHDQAITSAQAGDVRVPTLGVVGSLDSTLSAFRELNKLRPTMTLVVVDNATHGAVPARPEFINAVRAFITAHQAQ